MNNRKISCANTFLSTKKIKLEAMFRIVRNKIKKPGSFFGKNKTNNIPTTVKILINKAGVFLNMKRFRKSSFNTLSITRKTDVPIIPVKVKARLIEENSLVSHLGYIENPFHIDVEALMLFYQVF